HSPCVDMNQAVQLDSSLSGSHLARPESRCDWFCGHGVFLRRGFARRGLPRLGELVAIVNYDADTGASFTTSSDSGAEATTSAETSSAGTRLRAKDSQTGVQFFGPYRIWLADQVPHPLRRPPLLHGHIDVRLYNQVGGAGIRASGLDPRTRTARHIHFLA